MTEYQRQRKLLRDYLSRQRRAGLTVKTKLPKLVKNPTEKSVQRLQTLRTQAKQQAQKSRERVKRERAKIEKQKEDFMEKSLDEIVEESESYEAEPLIDLETGEIPYQSYSTEPSYEFDDFDFYDNVIEINIYDWAFNGTQTEYTDRIVRFIRDCKREYGLVNTAHVIMDMAGKGMSLTRLERYNNDYCHDWIAEFQEVLKEYGIRPDEEFRKKWEQEFLDANEDTFNDSLDAEVFESRYTGG